MYRGSVYRWVGTLLLAAGLLVPGVGRADPPPDVRGLSVSDARARLTAWNAAVVLQVLPESLPAGVDQSTVVVASSTLLNATAPAGVAAQRPQVRLTLGTTVPDLTGSTLAEATRVLAARGLSLRADPAGAGPEWTITGQRVAPGTIVEFGLAVGASFAAPDTGPPLVTVALVGGGGLVLLLLLGLLLIRALRGRSARARTPEQVTVRMHPGPVFGPHMTEAGPSVSVRLEPRYDPGTFTLQETLR